MDKAHWIVDSPVDPLTLVATDGVLSGLYMTQQRYRPDEDGFGRRDAAPFAEAIAQLEAYFAGELRTFAVRLAPQGTPFQQRVWAALQEIPYGHTVTYGQLATGLGKPSASRAVGLANGHNPLGIIVPCHRVVGANGNLTGYGGGLPRKRFLLDMEQKAAGLTLV